MKNDSYFMDLAIKEAQKSLDEGGLPIGAVLGVALQVLATLKKLNGVEGIVQIRVIILAVCFVLFVQCAQSSACVHAVTRRSRSNRRSYLICT